MVVGRAVGAVLRLPWNWTKSFAIRTTRWLLAYALLPVLALAVLRERLRHVRDKERNVARKPRIFWGCAPLINIKYHSEAVKRLGYESKTVVNGIYHINKREDFDHLTSEIVEAAPLARFLPRPLRAIVRDYSVFLWAIKRFDVFHFYYTGTILYYTPLYKHEMQLLRFARKKTVMMAYGGDVQAITRFRGLLFKHAQIMDYPAHVRTEPRILRDLDYFSKHADWIVAGADWVDYMPYWHQLIAAHFCIDPEEWKPADVERRRAPGDPVVVLHAPNHKEIKGTRHLRKAVEELKREGLPIELKVIEKVPNSVVKEAMRDCDIVADQFIVGWYAMFALEGMAMGKPVLTYLRPDLVELYSVFSYAGECPIVNTPVVRIKEVLRELVRDEELRRTLGKRGRQYVLDHHSLDSMGRLLDGVYRNLWSMP